MNKKQIIVITISIFIILLAIFFIFSSKFDEKAANVLHVKAYFENSILRNIQEIQSKDTTKPLVVVFYANYCKTCHEFMPAFKSLSKEYSKSYNFAALDIQNPENYPVVRGNVGGIPSLYIFDPEIGNKVHISLSAIRSYNELKAELDRYIRIRSFIDLEKAKTEQQKLMQAYFNEIKENIVEKN